MRLRGKPSKGTILVGLCLASAVCMVTTRSRWLCGVANPVLKLLSVVGMAAPVTIRSRVREMTDTPDRRIEEQTRALRQVIASQQEAIRTRDERIAALAGWRSKLGGFRCRLIEARVLGAEPIPLRDRRMLNVGTNRQVAEGDLVTTRRLIHEMGVALPPELVVLGTNYVVGRMVEPRAFSGTLQLVTDPAFEMPATLWRLVAPGEKRMVYVRTEDGGRREVFLAHDGKTPGLHAVGDPIVTQATGDGRHVVLRNVPGYYGVRPGDLLTTSRSWQLAPFQLRIGEVVRVAAEKENAHFVTVFVQPFADLASLSDVYVIQPVSR
ncbi:MAG TPA: rod shape-determining protein MreC [Phycisphaerae bacterium]|nr:rod shape-determining protein MreC [Phycisphaerae bacterium]HUU22105.1 rod shape-determining protein MreC [Phycisphaerae bacterium]